MQWLICNSSSTFEVHSFGASESFLVYVKAFYSRVWAHGRQYLGPSPLQLVHLLLLIAVNSTTLFLVAVTLIRTFWGLGGNVTTIESWEIERHRQLLRRARVLGGYLDGPDGIKVKLVKHEFPYDIGIWQNIQQGMGSANPLSWLWPFSRTQTNTGLEWETNGFEDPGTNWPPPDPDRMPRYNRVSQPGKAFTQGQKFVTREEEIQAFRMRQERDLMRRKTQDEPTRRRPFRHRFDANGSPKKSEDMYMQASSNSDSGEEAWQDYDGNRLKDFGVDENVEFYDEDDVPLAELMRRRRVTHG